MILIECTYYIGVYNWTFSNVTRITVIYTMILLKSVCQLSQTAGRNSCSIDSGDVSNCSYRLTVHPVTSSRLSSGYHAPMKSTRIQGNSLPWLAGEIDNSTYVTA